MNQGYVKLWRKTADSRVFQNEGLLKVWIWCLLRAAHKEIWVSIKTGRGQTEVLLKPGQFIFGRDSAAKKLRMKPTTVWVRMLKLKHLGNIDIESDRQYSIITIINWESYQSENKKNDIESDYRMTGKCLPNDTYKNDKKEKNNSNADKSGKKSKHNIFSQWWCEKYEMAFGKKYIITNGKKFGGQVQKLLSLPIEFKDLQYMAIEFFNDEDHFLSGDGDNPGTGYHIGMFLTKMGNNVYQKYQNEEFREKYKKHIVDGLLSKKGKPTQDAFTYVSGPEI